jgi:uncharacterized protein (TIGR02246 family)
LTIRHQRPTALLLAFVLCIGIGVATAQQKNTRASIEQLTQQFVTALKKGDAAAVAALYSADAKVLPPESEIIEGRQAIQKFWQGLIDAGVTEMTLQTQEVQAHGDTAYEVGKYTLTLKGEKPDSGKFVVVWKRENGHWKLHRDIWNTSVPAPTAAK